MDQSVMNFATSAARASAIPTPTEGMTSYISTTGTATIPQIETYTGSAWQTPYGMTLISTATVTTATTLTFSNVFSATYDNYKLVWNGLNSSSTQFKLVFGSTTSGYYAAQMDIRSNGGNPTLQLTQANAAFGYMGSNWTGGNIIETIISNPFNALYTTYRSDFTSTENGLAAIGYVGGHLNNTTSYTACTITTVAGTFTGTFRLYGIRNS
jgi:hypothetical protein